ncbi:MAG: dihydrolipoyllysine-residue succinyltransferase [Chlamydiales bacterium]|nr:dihydrolipoyllysine-residue succinyltransferase [Chlamydiales bacterium]
MKIEIKIPSMGESVSEAIVASILKPQGSFVKMDEEILELETDKVNQVLYAPQEGKLTWHVQVEERVSIGQVIGFIEPQAAPVETTPPSEKKPSPPVPEKKTSPPASPPPSSADSARYRMTDFVEEVKKGPPPSEKTAATPSKTGKEPTRKKMSSLRKVIAQKLVEAKNQTAMLTTFNEIDMSSIIQIRTQEKDSFIQKHGVKLGFMSFFVKAVVAALKEIPDIHAMLDREEIIQNNTYDIGVAVSTERGLMVPVIRDCDLLNFAQIESQLETYAKKAREGKISIDDLRGGSFTITNGGTFGSLLSTPILNPPQSAILGMHAIVKRAVVINDQILIRPMMYVALSYDHRIVDGKEAVLFLVHLKKTLEDPSRLLLNL